MNVYRLDPIEPGHPSWRFSDEKDTCGRALRRRSGRATWSPPSPASPNMARRRSIALAGRGCRLLRPSADHVPDEPGNRGQGRRQPRRPVRRRRGGAPPAGCRGVRRPPPSRRMAEMAPGRRPSSDRSPRRLWRLRRLLAGIDAPHIVRSLSTGTPPRRRFMHIAVGTLIAERPPHRTVRAGFPHTAPTSGV